MGGTSRGYPHGGGVPLPGGKRGPPGLYPGPCAPVVAGSLRRLPHHNNGLHLDEGVADNNIWKSQWCRLAAQSDSWYATPSIVVQHCFRAILI